MIIDMTSLNLGDIAQATTMIAAAIVAAVMVLQKVLKGFRETATEGSVIKMMHEELLRMSQQNSLLSIELNKLQLEIIKLNRELGNLSAENQKLHTEVSSLTAEVARLQIVLARNNIEVDGES